MGRIKFEGYGSENAECSTCGKALEPEDKEAGLCWDCQLAEEDQPEFPVYYDAQGREHQEF